MTKLSITILFLLSLTSHAEDYSIESLFENYDPIFSSSGNFFINFVDEEGERDYGLNNNTATLNNNHTRSYNELSISEKDHIQRVTDTLVYDYSNASDKYLHFSAGYVVGSIASELCSPIYKKQTNKSRRLRFWCSFGAATVAGVAKEFYDSTGRGQVEAADAIATSFGGLQFEIKF